MQSAPSALRVRRIASVIRSPATLAIGYLAVGSAWLWASGRLAGSVARNVAELQALEQFKGELFIGFTAALLYVWLSCLRRLEARLPQVEAQLHDSQEQTSRLLEFAPDAILIHDAARILYANPAFYRLFDIPPGTDLSKITLRDIVDPAHLPTMRERVRRLAAEVGIAAPAEATFRTLAGRRVDAEHASSSVLVDGKILVQSHLRDLTERNAAWRELQRWNDELDAKVRERTAELVAANTALECFTYSVAHDLRSPVGRMSGFAAALLDSVERQDCAKAAHFARRIVANATTMSEMIDGMLLLSRADRAPLKVGAVDMQALVRGCLAELDELSARWIEVEPLPDCRGDESLLRQVWANLLSNALKYSAGAATPRIVLRGQRVGGECVYCVFDNGIGFDAADAKDLFRPFQRLGNAHEFAGTGIGLSVVQRIVTRHGGRVWAQGCLHAGAKFCFALPA